MNGVLGQIGPGRDAGLRPEKAPRASDQLIKRMGAAESMEVPALAQGPRKDALGSLRPTYVTADIPRTS